MPGKDQVLWSWDVDEDGALPVGTIFSDWFDAKGISEILVGWTGSGGTTTIQVEHSLGKQGPPEQDLTSSAVTAGITSGTFIRPLGYYFRLKVDQATAPGNVSIAMKTAD